MRVTRELLERYESCEEGFKWLDAHYPEGEELMTILTSDPLPPPDFIVWGLKYFDVSNEERTAANLLLHNTNSTRVFGSWNVTDSDFIAGSQNVSNSKRVINSKNVSNSTDIHDCEDITDSQHLITVHHAINAEYAASSGNIQNSSYIYTSDSISWSEFIKSSLDIEDGVYCSLCKNSALLTLCEFMDNSSHCCVCFGLSGKENYLFNQPSTYERVEEIRTVIMNLLATETIDPKIIGQTPLSEFFKTLPQSVLSYIKSLPERTEVIGASFSSIL